MVKKRLSVEDQIDIAIYNYDLYQRRKAEELRIATLHKYAANQNFRRSIDNTYDTSLKQDPLANALNPFANQDTGGVFVQLGFLAAFPTFTVGTWAATVLGGVVDQLLHFNEYKEALKHQNDDLLFKLAPWVNPETGYPVLLTEEYLNFRASYWNKRKEELMRWITDNIRKCYKANVTYGRLAARTAGHASGYKLIENIPKSYLSTNETEPQQWDIQSWDKTTETDTDQMFKTERLEYYQNQNRYICEQIVERFKKTIETAQQSGEKGIVGFSYQL